MNQKTSDVNTQGEGNGNGKPKLKLNDEFLINIDGKDFILYRGLLDLAHQKGLKSLEVEMIQVPCKGNENLCICKATAISPNGDCYVDYGEASPANVSPKVARHAPRIASTRAKARVLRDFTNTGIVCVDEIDSDIGEESSNGQNKRQQKTPSSQKNQVEKPQSTQAPATETSQAQSKAPEEKKNENPSQKSSASIAESVPAMSAAQRRAVINISKRRGIEEDQLESMVNESFHIPFDQLSNKDASSFIKLLQQAA